MSISTRRDNVNIIGIYAHDVTIAILVYLNNETSAILVYLNNEKSAILVYQMIEIYEKSAILVYQISFVRVELCFNANTLFRLNKQVYAL